MKSTSLFIAALLCLSSSVLSAKTRIGLVLDKGGRDDKSFNAAAYKGAKEAEAKLGVELKVVESSDDASLEPSLRTFAQRGYDLVIGIGFVQAGPIEKVAKAFPKSKFLLVDDSVALPNVRAIAFEEHEGAYLVGAIAAATSKTGVVGFIGGMDIPMIRRFELGYKSGAQKINPKAQVVSNFVGSTSDAWRNPMKGKELALGQFNRKADIIFAAAGASALGAFDAVEEHKKLIIGCDSNQNALKPGRVLTSMLKRVDKAVYDTIELATKSQFQAGVFHWGLKEGGVDYAVDENNKALLKADVIKKVDALKAEIIAGKIVVPDFYKLRRTE